MGFLQRLYKVRKNGQFGSEIKNVKKIPKTNLQPHYSYSMQKGSRENSQYSKNDKILRGVKSGHFAKAIVRQNGQFAAEIKKTKTSKRRLYNLMGVILCKKRLEKTSNIGEITILSTCYSCWTEAPAQA